MLPSEVSEVGVPLAGGGVVAVATATATVAAVVDVVVDVVVVDVVVVVVVDVAVLVAVGEEESLSGIGGKEATNSSMGSKRPSERARR